MNCRHICTKFIEELLKILINTSNQKPHPSYTTKQKYVLEVSTEEARIQIWFQSHRARHWFQIMPELKEALESSQGPGWDHLWEQIQRSDSVVPPIAPQLHTLIKAFMDNPYPGIHSREQLAKEISLPETRVQLGFKIDLVCIEKENLMNPSNSFRDKVSVTDQGIEDT